MRVLVVEAIAPEGLAYLREHGVDVDELAKASPAELRARLPDYEGLITRSGTAVTAELLDHAPRLRIVGRAGVGVDNVDVEACSRRGIVVCNAPYGNVVSAAEHTLGMLLALVRRIPEAHARLKALEWNRGIYGAELYRKTVGVVGLGKAARVSRCACAGSRRTSSCTIRTSPRAARRTSAPGRWTSRRSCARPTSSPSTCRSRPRPRAWWPRASSPG